VKKYLSLILLVLLSGCARQSIEVPAGFFTKPESIVITEISGLKPYFHTHSSKGVVGILDAVVIDGVTTSIQEKVKEIDALETVQYYYYAQFKQSFSQRGFTTKEEKVPLVRENLSKAEGQEKEAPYNFKPLKDKYQVRYALILDPHAFGTLRSYYGFIPTSCPKGYADLSLYLVDLNNNLIVGEYRGSALAEPKGDWDTPPEYSPLVTAAKEALASVLQSAHAFIFKNQKGT